MKQNFARNHCLFFVKLLLHGLWSSVSWLKNYFNINYCNVIVKLVLRIHFRKNILFEFVTKVPVRSDTCSGYSAFIPKSSSVQFVRVFDHLHTYLYQGHYLDGLRPHCVCLRPNTSCCKRTPSSTCRFIKRIPCTFCRISYRAAAGRLRF